MEKYTYSMFQKLVSMVLCVVMLMTVPCSVQVL